VNDKKAKNQLVSSIISLTDSNVCVIDTAFKQQRLPAWQPIITADTALPVFLVIGLLFIPIGIVLIVTSERVDLLVCFIKLFYFN